MVRESLRERAIPDSRSPIRGPVALRPTLTGRLPLSHHPVAETRLNDGLCSHTFQRTMRAPAGALCRVCLMCEMFVKSWQDFSLFVNVCYRWTMLATFDTTEITEAVTQKHRNVVFRSVVLWSFCGSVVCSVLCDSVALLPACRAALGAGRWCCGGP